MKFRRSRYRYGRKRTYRRKRVVRRFTRRVKRAINRIAESKFYTASLGTNSAPYSVTITGSTWINPLAGIGQGATRGTRIGNRIFVKRVIIRIRMTPIVNAASFPTVRFMYGYWKNTFTTSTGPGTTPLEGGLVSNEAFHLLQPIDPDRFRAKRDRLFTLALPQTDVGVIFPGVPVYTRKIVWRINKSVTYNDLNTTIAETNIRPAIIIMAPNDTVNLWITATTYFTDV